MNTNNRYEVIFDTPQKGAYLRITTTGTVMIRDIHYRDDVTGWKSFRPLSIQIEGMDATLPVTISSGVSTLVLTGQPFDGTKLHILGYNLFHIERVEIFDNDPDGDVRSGCVNVVAGLNTIGFRKVSSTDYNITQCDLFLTVDGHIGQKSIAIPQVPPLNDSRTVTSFNVDCDDNGKLYYRIDPHAI